MLLGPANLIDPRYSVPDAHYRIHRGQAFSTHHNNASIADGVAMLIHMNTGATAPHMTVDASAKFDFDFEIIESPSAVSGGSPSVAYNRFRSSPKTSATSLTLDPATVTGGTIISSDTVSDGQKLGGSVDFGNEWILIPGTDYVFRLTSRANGNRAHINLTWYEPF